MALSPQEKFLLALEMERTDLSYLKPKPKVQVETVFVPQPTYPKSRQKRDKLMFDAGRYAAGDRDFDAIQAHQRLQEEQK